MAKQYRYVLVGLYRCRSCGRVEPLERWEVMGADEGCLICRHCSWHGRPRKEKEYAYHKHPPR